MADTSERAVDERDERRAVSGLRRRASHPRRPGYLALAPLPCLRDRLDERGAA